MSYQFCAHFVVVNQDETAVPKSLPCFSMGGLLGGLGTVGTQGSPGPEPLY